MSIEATYNDCITYAIDKLAIPQEQVRRADDLLLLLQEVDKAEAQVAVAFRLIDPEAPMLSLPRVWHVVPYDDQRSNMIDHRPGKDEPVELGKSFFDAIGHYVLKEEPRFTIRFMKRRSS